MVKSQWSEPYYGLSHRRIGTIQLTVCDRGSFIEAYAVNIINKPFTVSITEEIFDAGELTKAKRYLERKVIG